MKFTVCLVDFVEALRYRFVASDWVTDLQRDCSHGADHGAFVSFA